MNQLKANSESDAQLQVRLNEALMKAVLELIEMHKGSLRIISIHAKAH